MKRFWIILKLITSLGFVGLGTLWLLQGTGLLAIKPILCFANCEPLEGPSLTWGLIGLITSVIGGRWFVHAIRIYRKLLK